MVMGLEGPSRRIIVEPIRTAPLPQRQREEREPRRPPMPVPQRETEHVGAP